MIKQHHSYRDLEVWKEARKLVKTTYLLTVTFPEDERWGLTPQIRRASISIVSNIAEGIGRNHVRDTIKFLYTSRGSLYELESQLYIASDLGYINDEPLDHILSDCNQVGKLLSGFINYHEKKL